MKPPRYATLIQYMVIFTACTAVGLLDSAGLHHWDRWISITLMVLAIGAIAILPSISGFVDYCKGYNNGLRMGESRGVMKEIDRHLADLDKLRITAAQDRLGAIDRIIGEAKSRQTKPTTLN